MHAVMATGHPAIPTGDFDFTPLLYMALLLLLMRKTRVPFRIWVLPIAMVAGGLIESLSKGLGLPTPTTVALLVLVVLFVHPPRASTPSIHPPNV